MLLANSNDSHDGENVSEATPLQRSLGCRNLRRLAWRNAREKQWILWFLFWDFNGFLSIEFSRVLWELFGICIDLLEDLCGVLCKM